MNTKTNSRLALIDPERLVKAARTSIALIDMLYETIWRLYPDELLVISEESEDILIRLLANAIQEQLPPEHPHDLV